MFTSEQLDISLASQHTVGFLYFDMTTFSQSVPLLFVQQHYLLASLPVLSLGDTRKIVAHHAWDEHSRHVR